MANFSTNQVRQFYVVTDQTAIPAVEHLDDAAGAMVVNGDGATMLWFEYITPNGDHGGKGAVRSDIIPLDKVVYANATGPITKPLRQQTVTFDPSINGGNPVVGQDYILRFRFTDLGIGGPENQYIRNGGAYRVRPGDTPATVADALVELFNKNFSREAFPFVTVEAVGSTIVVQEVIQPWVLGKRQAAQVPFDVQCVPINAGFGTFPWGLVEDTTASNVGTDNVITNGRMTADMEWFYIGERADIFRGMGYPDNFTTKYLADPYKEYNFIDICYYYAGNNEDIQKSQKFITLAVPTDSPYSAAGIVSDLNSMGIPVEISPSVPLV